MTSRQRYADFIEHIATELELPPESLYRVSSLDYWLDHLNLEELLSLVCHANCNPFDYGLTDPPARWDVVDTITDTVDAMRLDCGYRGYYELLERAHVYA